MFEGGATGTETLEGLVSALSRVGGRAADDAERVDQLDLLERVKAACAAAQVRVTVDLAESQAQIADEWRAYARAASDAGDFEAWRDARAKARAASCPEADDPTEPDFTKQRQAHGRRDDSGVAAQVALARRESPHAGSRLVRLAFALTHEMTFVLHLLERGLLSERRATVVVRECAYLTLEQRAQVDTELAESVGEELGRLSERELTTRVRAIAYRLDAQAVVERAAHAESERRVTLRPAPDAMCWLTALLPAVQGVAALAALTRAADSAKAAGVLRGRGPVMADTLVARVTGQSAADIVPVEVQVVVTDRALLSGDGTPARLEGYGSLPAELVRGLLTRPATPRQTAAGALDLAEQAQVWLRRLYTHPADGTLVAMDSHRRVFDGPLRRFIVARDGGTCRTPGCGAPIRQVDHVSRHADGGATAALNAQGLCVRCNLVKELIGWRAHTLDPPTGSGAHTVEVVTPTGHRYASTAPPPVHQAPGLSASPLERAWELALAA